MHIFSAFFYKKIDYATWRRGTFFYYFSSLCVFMEASTCRKRFKHPFKFKHTKKINFPFLLEFFNRLLFAHPRATTRRSHQNLMVNHVKIITLTFAEMIFSHRRLQARHKGNNFGGIEHEREREILQARFYDSRPFVASYFHNNIFLHFFVYFLTKKQIYG